MLEQARLVDCADWFRKFTVFEFESRFTCVSLARLIHVAYLS